MFAPQNHQASKTTWAPIPVRCHRMSTLLVIVTMGSLSPTTPFTKWIHHIQNMKTPCCPIYKVLWA